MIRSSLVVLIVVSATAQLQKDDASLDDILADISMEYNGKMKGAELVAGITDDVESGTDVTGKSAATDVTRYAARHTSVSTAGHGETISVTTQAPTSWKRRGARFSENRATDLRATLITTSLVITGIFLGLLNRFKAKASHDRPKDVRIDMPAQLSPSSDDAESAQPQPSAKQHKVRVARWDNVRCLLSVLVSVYSFQGVFGGGQLMELGLEPAKTWMLMFESAAVPCFVLVSGIVASSASESLETRRVRSSVSLLVTFILAQLAYVALAALLPNSWWSPFPRQVSWATVLWTPHSHLWFVACLLWWRLVAPFYLALRGLFPIVLALLTTVTVGYASRSRDWYYVFFYVLGVWLKHNHAIPRLEKLVELWRVKIFAVLWLVLNLGVLGLLVSRVTYPEPYSRTSMRDWLNVGTAGAEGFNYKALKTALPWERGTDEKMYLWYAWSYELILLMWQVLNSLSIIALTPATRCWASDFGRRTLTSYIFHVFFVQAWVWTGIVNNSSWNCLGSKAMGAVGPAGFRCFWQQGVSLAYAVVVSLALMTTWAERMLWLIVKPPIGFLFDADTPPASSDTKSAPLTKQISTSDKPVE